MSLTRASRLKRLRSSPAWPLLLFICVMGLLAVQRSGYLRPVENLLLQGLEPGVRGLHGLGTALRDLSETARDLATLRARNDELQAQVNQLLIDKVRADEVEQEYEQTRRLLGFAEANPNLTVRGSQIVGRVLAESPNNYVDSIQVDLGQQHGIRPGMAVVTERGLVGRVTEVFATTSQVMLLTDPNSSVSAFIQSSRLQGVIKGQVGSPLLLMDRIPQDFQVSPGDIVLTSGLGGNLPRNLVIGQVVSVRSRDYEMFQQAVVRPTVDFRRLEMVLVITGFQERTTASPTPVP
ncbi:MAG: rod shape-determining protein MreC [Anaerolineae bacterium]|nr:rod shape-determining protein MreC [Anaerolineae bacterium]